MLDLLVMAGHCPAFFIVFFRDKQTKRLKIALKFP